VIRQNRSSRPHFSEKVVKNMAEGKYDSNEIYEKLIKYIQDIRYGSVVVVIQDGKIVQIEKNEKVRFV
jgi:Uncharacterized small protein